MNIQLYIIFHRNIHEECYSNIPDDALKKYFTFIAVNKNIEKQYNYQRNYNIIKEWELPIYAPYFQDQGYKENSVMYHVYANKLHEKYDFVGFFQYDMVFGDNIIKDNNCIYVTKEYPYDTCAHSWGPGYESIHDTFTNLYEIYFNKKIDKTKDYPMLNSYIIHSNLFEKIMKFVVLLYNILEEPIKAISSNPDHIATFYERVMGFSIGNEDLKHIQLNVTHENHLKN